MSKTGEVVTAYGEIIDRFAAHIGDATNSNIFFSGRYGLGKSTFLRHFFQERTTQYYPVFLSPVHYVVNSNEDIFELIKVDIIKQLHADGHLEIDLPELKGKAFVKLINYAGKNPIRIVASLSSALAKLHPAMEFVAGGAKAVHELINDFAAFEKKFNDEVLKTEDEQLNDKVAEWQNRKGTYLEFDIISKMLASSIEKIGSDELEGSTQRTVLVIDDLDRLDPEHIFRILNIFSAHQVGNNNSHKFGFDHVVIVADLNNIRNIYHHKYGEKAEFEGYIDKFFSTEHFDFSSRELILNYIKEHVNVDESDQFKDVLSEVLTSLVLCERLKMRDISKHDRLVGFQRVVVWNTKFKFNNSRPAFIGCDVLEIYSNEVEILKIFWYLAKILGNAHLVDSALEELVKTGQTPRNQLHKSFLSMLTIGHLCGIATKDSDHAHKLYSNWDRMREQYLYNPKLNVPFLGGTSHLSLVWDNHNPYSGKGNYFDSHQIRHASSNSTELSGIYEEFKSQFRYFRTKGTLSRVGVTS